MTKKFEIYLCKICGNTVESLNNAIGELVCCNQPMKLLTPQTEEMLGEKHKPVITDYNGEIEIRVGQIPHPMTKEHHIEFIEAISLDGKYLKRKYLTPNEAAELKFECKTNKMLARELCNLHGLWEERAE